MNKKTADVGIIMSVYNEETEWLCAAIDSILGQTYEALRFYILLDNPENKKLKEIIKSYQQKDGRILFFENSSNIGLVRSLNKLIKLVEEPFIARMDADDVAKPERIEKEIKFLKNNKLDFVMTGADYLDEEGNISPGDNIPQLLAKQVAECSKYGNVSIHSSWLMKKEVYLKLNGYRNCKYCEDYDFILRALQADIKIGRLKEHLQMYRVRRNGITAQYALEQDQKVAFLRKCYISGEQIENLEVENLNVRFSDVSDKEVKNYCRDKADIDRLAQYLYKKKIGMSVMIMAKGFVRGHYFRKIFSEKFVNKVKLNRIYNGKEFS